MNTNILWKMISLLIAASLLSACSGGSSTIVATKPNNATLSLSLEPIKNFQFSWDSVSDTTHYKLMEQLDGTSGFTQVGANIPQGTLLKEHIVSLPKRIDAQYILKSCNAQGCTDSETISVAGSLVNSIGYLKASNTEKDDWFGFSVSLSADGNTLAVGARNEDSNARGINGNQADNSATNSGAVYLFIRTGATWTQQAYLKASNVDCFDRFGTSVTLSADGNTLAVWARNEYSNATGIDGDQANNSAMGSGAVYLFIRTGTTWTQQVYLKASNTEKFDSFGSSISLSADGNTLAVGAVGEGSSSMGIDGDQANNFAPSSGAVYLFIRTGTRWTQEAYLKASNTEKFDSFGYSISLSADGNTLVVGARNEDSRATGINGDQADNSASSSGAVYLFTRTGALWTQQVYLKASNAGVDDLFGHSVSLSADGNTLVVGATSEDSNVTGINGDQADNSASSSGAVYLFTRIGGTWAQEAYLKASNTEKFDSFGYSISLSADGNALAVAAHLENSCAVGINGDQADNSATNSGVVYLFIRTGALWVQQAYVKASNAESNDTFGTSLSLSADGNTLAVGANRDSSKATDIGGNQADNFSGSSGAVYLY